MMINWKSAATTFRIRYRYYRELGEVFMRFAAEFKAQARTAQLNSEILRAKLEEKDDD